METYVKWIIGVVVFLIIIALIWWVYDKYKSSSSSSETQPDVPAAGASPVASPAISPAPGTPTSEGFQIQSATWGGQDYTSQVASVLDPTTGSLKGPLYQTLGDPTPGAIKTLVVNYTYNELPHTFTWSEANNHARDTLVQLPAS